MANEAHTKGPIETRLRTAALLQRECRAITWEFGTEIVNMCAEHGDAIADAVVMAGDPVRAAAPKLYEALKETLGEAVEHRKNIIEARTENFMGVGNPALQEAYDKEIARFDAMIDRARSALARAALKEKN